MILDVEGTLCVHQTRSKSDDQRLCSGVFAPDVEDKNGSNKHQGHNKHWNWTNFDTGRIFGVKLPHASGLISGSGADRGGLLWSTKFKISIG